MPNEQKKFNKLFIQTDKWFVAYEDKREGNDFKLRATATIEFLTKEVDYTIAFMTGEEKKEVYRSLVDPTGNLANSPARVMLTMKDVQLFTDISLKIR